MTGAQYPAPGAIGSGGMFLIGLTVGVIGTLVAVNVTGEKTARKIGKKGWDALKKTL